MTHKNKTAAAMGMLNLYEVSVTKRYNYNQVWYIKADNLKEAQAKWGSYRDIRFIEQQHSDPDIHYYYSKERDTDYECDMGWSDQTGDTVDEVKFDKKNDLHKTAVDDMYDKDNQE